MCCSEQGAGPETDSEFFADIWKVFDKYPGASATYSISTLPRQVQQLGINLETHEGVTKIEGDRIVIEFEPRVLRRAHHACCEWSRGDHNRTCLRWCLE